MYVHPIGDRTESQNGNTEIVFPIDQPFQFNFAHPLFVTIELISQSFSIVYHEFGEKNTKRSTNGKSISIDCFSASPHFLPTVYDNVFQHHPSEPRIFRINGE